MRHYSSNTNADTQLLILRHHTGRRPSRTNNKNNTITMLFIAPKFTSAAIYALNKFAACTNCCSLHLILLIYMTLHNIHKTQSNKPWHHSSCTSDQTVPIQSSSNDRWLSSCHNVQAQRTACMSQMNRSLLSQKDEDQAAEES